ncbi:cytochrome P450 [Trametes sanguinea]|nr:cytochrome P450 [Trametes sanguinea]
MLQWIMDEAKNRNGNDVTIVERILLMNFAAIHTSSNVRMCSLTHMPLPTQRHDIQSITHAIYHIAEHPEYLQTLREEIEPIVKEEGWTKTGMAKMWKLDSLLRESQRHNGINIISLMRKAVKDIVLSNGTLIPRGALIVAASTPLHHDNNIYADAEVFDPFRFARQRESEGESLKHQYANTSIEYIAFGHGKHAW